MIPRGLTTPKISGKRKALIFGSVTLLSFFSRYAEGVSIEPPSRKYPTVDAPRCAKALQLHPRKVSDIKGGKRIEFAWRDTRYWIEVRNEKGEEGENPVEWSNRSSDADTSSLGKAAPVMGTIRIDEGESILHLDTAWDGKAFIILSKKDDRITLRSYINEYTPTFDSEDNPVPRDPKLKKPVFHLLHQAAFPGVHRGDLSFYSRESTSLVVGDIGRKFFYVAKPNRQIEIAMAYSDIVSELPTQIVQNSTSEINSNHVRYLDTEGEIRFAKVYPLFNFVQMAVHLPKQNSRYPWTAIWIKDWTEEKGSLVSAQMLDFLGISMEKAKLLLAGDGILTREKLEGLFGPLFFGENP